MTFSYFEELGIINYDFPLNTVCTMRTGGNAKYAFFPKNIDQLKEVISFLKKEYIRYKILGNGSNTVFRDEGYDGAVVLTVDIKSLYDIVEGEKCDFDLNFDNDIRTIYVSAGYSLTSLASKLLRAGYSGLEFAYGIPASVGGAVYMNAGAYGGEMKNVIDSVEYLTSEGEIKYLKNSPEFDYFKYRHSYFTDHPDCIITGVFLKLNHADGFDPMDQAEKNMRSRKEKQPLEYPSCGSAFKRPQGYYAGALIEQAGLKGFSIGGACVSEKHAGFIVNKGGATTSDVMALIEYVRNRVFENSNVLLEPEIRVVED